MYYALKVIISAALIVIISEISKKYQLIGAILASIPLISVMAIIWMYFETKDIESIQTFSKSVFWLVLPSLSFFIIFPLMLKYNLNFWVSFLSSTAIMVVLYYLLTLVLKKFGA
ncbi:MAG: DUF3147 family protein [Candidatus Delongbacteria bacterium]|jgi:hypothetical protein|nr:DUF3147 family protein [Candidatus Delongbacteria bacterium]